MPQIAYSPAKMQRALVASFDETDIAMICFELTEHLRKSLKDKALDFDYENLKGEDKRGTALALVKRCQQRGVMDDLARLMLEGRTNLDITEPLAADADSSEEEPPPGDRRVNKFCGDYRHIMCDRIRQMSQFNRFFKPSLSRYSGIPQVYLVHGTEGQSHSNFVQRLVLEKIRPYAESQKGAMHGTVTHIKPNRLEATDKIELLKEDMKIGTFEKISPSYDPDYMSAETLCNHDKFKRLAYVVIEHSFEVQAQSTQLKSLIEWYLKSYWAEVSRPVRPDVSRPQFIIVINFVYPATSWPLWHHIFPSRDVEVENFKLFLPELCKSVNELYPCLLFDELLYPDQKELCRTLSDLGFDDDGECPQWLKELYKKKRGKVKMIEVEKQLKKPNRGNLSSSTSVWASTVNDRGTPYG